MYSKHENIETEMIEIFLDADWVKSKTKPEFNYWVPCIGWWEFGVMIKYREKNVLRYQVLKQNTI